MQKVSAENAKSYVYYCAENYVSLGHLKALIGAYSIFALFALMCIVFGEEYLYSSILLALYLLYTITVIIFSIKSDQINSFSLRFLVSGVFSVFGSVFFLCFAYLILSLVNGPIINYIIISLCYLVVILLYNGVILINVKKGKYTDRKSSKNSKIPFWALIGSGAGVGVARILRKHLNDNIIQHILPFLLCVISLAFALASQHFLKYYFARKYNITCDEEGNNSSIFLTNYDKKPKQQRLKTVKKVLRITLLIIGAFFLICFLIGVIQGIRDNFL